MAVCLQMQAATRLHTALSAVVSLSIVLSGCGDDTEKTSLTQIVLIADSMGVPIGIDKRSLFFELLLRNEDQLYPKWSNKALLDLYPNMRTVKIAKIGYPSSRLLPELTNVPEKPDGRSLVIVAMGFDDFSHMLTEQNLEKVIDSVRELKLNIKQLLRYFQNKTRFPNGVDVVILNHQDLSEGLGLVAPFWPGGGFCSMWPRENNEVAEVYRQMFLRLTAMLASLSEEEHFMLADVNSLMRGHGAWFWLKESPYYYKDDPTFWFTADCLHLNERAHHAIRELIWKLLPERITNPQRP